MALHHLSGRKTNLGKSRPGYLPQQATDCFKLLVFALVSTCLFTPSIMEEKLESGEVIEMDTRGL